MYTSKEMAYRVLSLSDVNVIELLLTFRYKYDDYLYLGRESAWDNQETLGFNSEVIDLFADFDELIESSGLNEEQRKLIKYFEWGYNYDELAAMFSTSPSSIKGRIKTIARRIKKQNDWKWRESVYKYKLGLKSKSCSKCKKELPATVEFFRDDYRNKDGFQSRCRSCE